MFFQRCGGAKIKSFSGRLECRTFLCLLVSIITVMSVIFCSKLVILHCLNTIGGNGSQLPEGGDFEALHCQTSTNFDRCTKLDLTTEPPLLGRCCYALAFLSLQPFSDNYFNAKMVSPLCLSIVISEVSSA
jgi:hypothetical protein